MKRLLLLVAFAALAAAQITVTQFGIHATPAVTGTGATPWMPFSVGIMRSLGDAVNWVDNNPSNGVYTWQTPNSAISKTLNSMTAHGVTRIIFELNRTPTWASSAPTDATCKDYAGRLGTCDAPNDLAADGTGTNQHFKDYVTALVAWVAANYPTVSAHYELWNEPNAAGFYNGTLAQLVRMERDAAAIVHPAGAKLLCPPPGTAGLVSGASWLRTYFAAGGGQLCDVIGWHGYVGAPRGVSNPPETVLGGYAEVVSAMAAASPPITVPNWDTEGSWLNDTSLPVLSDQANWLARWYLVQLFSAIPEVIWYSYDLSTQGTLYSAGALQAPGRAYQVIQNWLIGGTPAGACTITGSLYECQFTRPGGYTGLIVWNASTTTNYTSASQWTRYTPLAGSLTTISAPGTTAIPVGPAPILFEGAAAPLCPCGACATGNVRLAGGAARR